MILLLSVLGCALWAGELPCEEVVLVGDGTRGPYDLGGYIVVKGTEEVCYGGRKLGRGEYCLEEGKLRLSFPLPVGDTLRVRFRALPLRRSYGLGKSDPGTSRNLPEVRLEVGGSKSVGISVGSERGASLEQSLHLRVSGDLGGTKVLAVLSDRDLPFQPEGTTQGLEEMDKVLVKVSGGRFSATFGDYEVGWRDGQFGRYGRRLEGVLGEVRTERLELSLAMADDRGKFCTNFFVGEDQGPYQLRSEDGDGSIVVLAGTERVWVDGERMERGDDYTIDYSSAQVTFTPRRQIKPGSRIVVDFCYLGRHYPKTTLAARGRLRLLKGRVEAFGMWAREAEDGRRPLDFSLSPGTLASLRCAGDDPGKAAFPGAEPEDGGAYRFVDGHYEYVGQGLGTHRVTFSFVGEGKGDYRYLGRGIYEYVGPGGGAYSPGRSLPLPELRELLSLGVGLRPSDWVRVEGEWATSLHDGNVLSPIDDEDNIARAYRFEVEAGRGKWKLRGVVRHVGEGFFPLDRIYDVERDRGLPPSRGSDEREVSAIYAPMRNTRLSVGYARLGRGEPSARWRVELMSREEGWPELTASEERVVGPEGAFLKRRVRLDHGWRVGPFLLYDLESSPRLRRLEWEGGVSGREGSLRWKVGYGRLEEASCVEWLGAELEAGRYFEGGYTWRSEGGPLGWLKARVPLGEATALSLDGEVTEGRAPGLEERFIYAGIGRGGYSWEDRDGDGRTEEGEFFPDPEGDYMKYLAPVRPYRAVRRARLGAKLSFRPRGFSSVTSFYGTCAKLRDGGSLREKLSLRQDLEVFGRWGSLRGFLIWDEEEDLSFGRRDGRIGARLRLFTGRSEVELGAEGGLRERHSSYEDYLISGGSLSGSYFLGLGGGRMGGRLELGRDLERTEGKRADYVSFRPEVERSFGRFRVWGYVEVAGVRAPKEVPYEMAGGRRPRLNIKWALRLGRRMGRSTRLSISCTGRERPGRRLRYTMRTEVRANF